MAFGFLRKSLFLKNKHLLLFYANEYIDHLERTAPGISCKSDLMEAVSKDIDQYKSEIATYTDKSDDFKAIAKRTVSNLAFDLIASGKYHLGGHLNTTGPAKNLIYIHKQAVKEFYEAGYITKEDYDEDLLALDEAIRQRL